MPLPFETFLHGPHKEQGQVLFKALGHPLTAQKSRALVKQLSQCRRVALYDPDGLAATFNAYYDLESLPVEGCYVQNIQDIQDTQGRWKGCAVRPLDAMPQADVDAVFALVFNAKRRLSSISFLFPKAARLTTLDDVRLDDQMLTNPQNYLDPLNFATNFAFLRDIQGDGGLHTRLTVVNYWGQRGAHHPEVWLCLFDGDGQVLAEWTVPLGDPGASLVIDSQEVRARFGLGDFTGSLFIHAVRIAGHDLIKYAFDTYGQADRALSCNHDANPFPADYYAGMPAPSDQERLILHIQNSHPLTVPAREVALCRVGRDDEKVPLQQDIPPFATRSIEVGKLLPEARFPDQIEIQAGKYFVRPRYEVIHTQGHRRIAHANIERTDLHSDDRLPHLGESLGKGYIMPLPVLPVEEFESVLVPTPMARAQQELPLRCEIFNAEGTCVVAKYLGRLKRAESLALDVRAWLTQENAQLKQGYGHAEFLYDFREGGEADGWLHALGRYEHRHSTHRAETIFGAHIYNIPMVYGSEPQSYTGPPPGLTTRLFLRLGGEGSETLCHLIYPASCPWHPVSSTRLILHDAQGHEVAQEEMSIPCGGSRLWRYREIFSAAQQKKAGSGYIIVRDPTCRLFGFHGLLRSRGRFSLDHMFGF